MELLIEATNRKSAGLADADGRLLVSDGGGVTGATDDAAWDGVADDASVIALLKAIWAKLSEIEVNTST